MALHLILILCPIYLIPLPLASACNSTCGNVTISRPFGMNDPKCYQDEWFEIECRQDSGTGTDKPYLKSFHLEVLEIDDSSGKVWINNPIYRWNCKNKTRDGGRRIDMSGSPFSYSRDNNVFLGVGCNTQALLQYASNGSDVLGCVSICDEDHESVNGIRGCVGKYCCTTALPSSLLIYNPRIEVTAGNTSARDPGDCNYALIAEDQGHNDWGRRILSEFKDSNSVSAVLEYHPPGPYE